MGSPSIASRSTKDNTSVREPSAKRHSGEYRPCHAKTTYSTKARTTAKQCRNYAQGYCRYGDTCSYPHVLHAESECSPTTSPALAYPPAYLHTDSYDIHASVYCEPLSYDASNAPFGTPATPASCITEVYSPVLSPQAPPGLSPVKGTPTKTEERSPRRRRQGSRSSTESGGCFYRSESPHLIQIAGISVWLTRKRPAKPCRFFHGGSGFCVKGDRCNL